MNNQIQLLKRTNSATKSALTRNAKIISTKNTVYAKYNDIMNKKNIAVRNYNALLDVEKKTKEQRIRLNYLKAAISEFKKDITVINKEVKKVQNALKDKKEYDDHIKQQNALVRQSVVRISENENSDFYFITHGVQLNRMKRLAPNMLYRQIIEYFSADGTYTDNNSYHSHIYEMRNVTEDNINTIIFNETLNGSEGDWKPQILPDAEHGAYTVITTQAISPLQFDNNNLQLAEQVFQLKDDNKKTCVIDACIKFFEARSENPKAKTMLNRLIKNYSLYENGIPESEMSKFGEMIQSSLNIIDFISGTTKSFNKSSYNRFAIEFINTRFNHIELLNHNYDEPKLISKGEYDSIKEHEPFYIDKYGTLTTQDNTYKIDTTDFKNTYKKWYDDCDIDKKFIYSDSDEYNLINGYEYNMHNFFKNDIKPDDSLYYEIDYKKAFYNYADKKYNKHYKGVPSGSFITFKCSDKFSIKDFEETELIGFYHIEIINIKSHDKHCEKMGFIVGSKHVLPTSNIDVLKNIVDFKFLNATVSPPCHVPFSPELLNTFNNNTGDLVEKPQKDLTNIKGYCKAYGILLSEHAFCIEIKPLKDDMQYYNLINNDSYDMFKLDNGLIKIYDKSIKARRFKHITYSIHGYLMAQMYELIFTLDINMIVGIKLDSLILDKKYKPKFNTFIFDTKSAKIQKMINNLERENVIYTASAFYGPIKNNNETEYDYKLLPFKDINIIKKRVIFLGGAGGTGKTTSLLNAFLNLPLSAFATTCWDLVEKKTSQNEGLMGYSMNKLTGITRNGSKIEKTEKIDNNRIKYIILDEATLLNKDDVESIIKDYNDKIIFILGDIDEDDFYYQCSINKNIIKPSTIKCQYIKFTKSYRFDDNLNEKLNKLREFMKLNHTKNGAINSLNKYVKDNFKECFKNKDDVVFNNKDIGISGLNDFKRGNELTKYFIEKGTQIKYFVKTTLFQKGLFRGRELTEKPNNENYEAKLFKTIHSFQGCELEQDNKIIISVKNNFDYNLYYTALSRARRLDQIIILNN